jgi:site-specific DNA-methyltransferase (adenine-specific)
MTLENATPVAPVHAIVPHPETTEVTLEPYFENEQCKIYHGDCFTVLHHLEGIGAIITDPPYSSGGAFRSDRTKGVAEKYVQTQTQAYRPDFAGDNRDQRSFLAWCALWMAAAKNASVPGAPIACFIDWRQLPTMSDAIQAGGWTWRGVAVWSKKFGRPTPGRFSNACEYVCWGSNGPMPERDAYPPGVFECSPPSGDAKQHIAQKPEAVMKWVLSIVAEGVTVCDPFMGSGTTLRAAMDSGCKAIGIEVDERYCELAANRLRQSVLF